MSSSRGQPRVRGPSRRRRQRPVGPRGVGGRPMAHLLSRSHRAPSRAGPPPGVDAGRCEPPAPSRMTNDLQFVHYVPRPKGQLSELELHTIKGRLTAGLLNMAQRGELALTRPVGLARNPLGQVVKRPDREVQDRISLVFAIFLRVRSLAKVVRSFNDQDLLVPRRDAFGDVVWRRPTVSSAGAILKNPAYAGSFVYGRTRTDRTGPDHTPVQKPLPITEWRIPIRA